MKEFNFYSFEPKVSTTSQKIKKELIEIDNYNLLIKFVSFRITFEELVKGIQLLSTLNVFSETELKSKIKNSISYEAYQSCIGKGPENREKVKRCIVKVKNEF